VNRAGRNWLVSDQRNAAARTDVLDFSYARAQRASEDQAGEPSPIWVAPPAEPMAIFVKLIDVIPTRSARDPKMGGYQADGFPDILRGRYRDSFSAPKPIPADKSQVFRFPLPTTNHVFLAGHRIMVQVQSTWFPIYDRNPQTYVGQHFLCEPADYKKATIKVFDAGPTSSFVDLTGSGRPERTLANSPSGRVERRWRVGRRRGGRKTAGSVKGM